MRSDKTRESSWTENGALSTDPDAIEGPMTDDYTHWEAEDAELEAVYERLAQRAYAAATPESRADIERANGRTVGRGSTLHFTDEQVREIRGAKTKLDVKRLMKKYKCTSTTIYAIRSLLTYRQVE